MKCLFFDVDGTLVPFGKPVPRDTIEALAQAKANGSRLFLSTGRSPAEVDPRLSEIPFDGGVYSGGARAFVDGRDIYASYIPADDLAFSVGVNVSPQQVEQVLEVIRGFDPPGVGAHSLQDCLSLQLRQMEDTPSVRLARRIVSDFFPALGKKNYAQIQERTGCSREELADLVHKIRAKEKN